MYANAEMNSQNSYFKKKKKMPTSDTQLDDETSL